MRGILCDRGAPVNIKPMILGWLVYRLVTAAMTKRREYQKWQCKGFPWEWQGRTRLRLSTSEGHWKWTGLDSLSDSQGWDGTVMRNVGIKIMWAETCWWWQEKESEEDQREDIWMWWRREDEVFDPSIYTIIIIKSVCRCPKTAGRNSCSIVSGDVSNCSYRLTVHPLTSSRVSSA